MKHLKKIGFIGGVGPQATLFIYEKVISYAQKKYCAKNNDDYPYLIIESIPIPDFISNTAQLNNALAMLKKTVSHFNTLSVDAIVIGSNTVHILLPELKKQTLIPIISTISSVVDICCQKNYKKVGILASPVLIKSLLYQKVLNGVKIDAIVPTINELTVVERMIRSVLAGSTDHKDKEKYISIINRMLLQGAQSLILGCTELPLAINYEALGSRTINSDDILAERIVDYYYQ